MMKIEEVDTLIRKAAEYRRAVKALDDAEFELRCVNVEEILNPYIGNELIVTRINMKGEKSVVIGRLICVNPYYIKLDTEDIGTIHIDIEEIRDIK